jgi:DNA-binding response OmpR family regulator
VRHSVLIVEDDSGFSRLLEIYLGRSHAVTLAHTIQDAMIILDQQSFDCVVLDLNLPDGSSWDLLRKLSHEHASTHTLVITGLSDEHTVELASALGAGLVRAKPVTPRDIKSAIDRLLQ